MESTSLRVYGGITGDDRQAERRAQFVEAGLALLGAEDGEPNLTVRGACKQAGLAARYFYESFEDRDALAVAVFDHVVSEIAATTLAAVKAAEPDPRAKSAAGLRAIVRLIAGDPRRGRLLFSPAISTPVLLNRRAESTRMFAHLLSTQARDFYGIADSSHLDLATEFLVGGLGQTLASWLDGTLPISEDDIVARCTEIFLHLAELR
ncbi:TetR/AcrR family transcriptional regulator [Amycolatopsis sp. CA-230715]|uniref:TetR/AcrR family transcriptional regulator n=1 Tax=Amycolatopsis sp. CA-230715 TaxID=2745196 RepID=UPI001C023846|nr:TetR/AcrR family transcriptional regulator [Amycolatopsis sp. CA-230715]